VAAIHVAGVCGDPCGAVRWIAVQGTARSKYIGILLCIFMYFNIEISILD